MHDIKCNPFVKIHFIGIGGIGMSGIAEILLKMGYKVTGSDISHSVTVDRLTELGANIFIGHREENITDQTTVVYSSAIVENNPEFRVAREKKIPIMKRAEMLAELMRLKKGIAVAGTHGKTTTTSFLATILQGGGVDPTYVIGGIVENLNGHANIGKGEYLVAEADESDGSFLLLNPILSVITNIDQDHMNFYKDENNLLEAFEDFANKIPFYGVCAINAHDKRLQEIRKRMKKPYALFGLKQGFEGKLDYDARNLKYFENSSSFDLYINDEFQKNIQINLPGEHNVLNALGAITVSHKLGLDIDTISLSIAAFKGVGRRFQTLYKNENLEIIDDYGHHPTEIMATIKAAVETRPENKIKVIFEPHRYSRTKECWNDFLHCFNQAHEVYLCPIYPASEDSIPGISSSILANDINKIHPELVKSIEVDEISDILNTVEEKKMTFLVLGAGTIGKKIREIVQNEFN
ncbi:MAG: UDP-N-acetylmuramate--L-alanine ligase [Bdellovibrionales bacterium]|jgi:UDP-N-acetylmuramate--alanine ligase|nr:UDP-N-acetylmuramate--L-alanine ligase [Bdellovibrionales bacterium]